MISKNLSDIFLHVLSKRQVVWNQIKSGLFSWYAQGSNCLQRLSVEDATSSKQIVMYDATIQEHFLKGFSELTRPHGFIKYTCTHIKTKSMKV